MRATDHQRIAADPRISAWVMASAGTGKTHVLTDRVLRLLLTGCPPERILCLTFTRAAAAEMAIRLHGRLGAWVAASDDDLQLDLINLIGQMVDSQTISLARRLFSQVLDTPGGFKVQTIHSFCESLLRRFPLEAGLAPHFQVMDERHARDVLAQALQKVLQEDTEKSISLVATLMELVDEGTFKNLIKDITADRGHFQRFLDGPNGMIELQKKIRQTLSLAPDDNETSLLRSACRDEKFEGPELHNIADAMSMGGKIEQRHGQIILDWLSMPQDRSKNFDVYLTAFFTEKGRGKPYAHPLTKKTITCVPRGLETIGKEVVRLSALRNHLNSARVAAATESLLAIGAQLIACYELEKQRQALLDYDDLVLKTGELFSGGASTDWVLYKLDGGLNHILIDEAQDTNPEQWQVVRQLADEFFSSENTLKDVEDCHQVSARTLFAVGDVKQSIYSFQRADPAAFQEMQHHFGTKASAAKQRWQQVELARSFRSTPEVLAAVDAIFADSAARDGLDLGPAKDIRHIPNRTTDCGLVEIWPTVLPEKVNSEDAWEPPTKQNYHETPEARLANRIADKIANWLKIGEILVSRGRSVEPGDILILVQRRATFVEAMVRALKRRRIPVAGVDRMVLTEQLAVMDLMALGEFLLLPEDDLKLAIVLKSPLIGWNENQLFELAHKRNGSLWAALCLRPESHACRTLSNLLAKANSSPPFELYAELLGAGGARRKILARLGPDANDPINEFLNLALAYERDNTPSLQGFLYWLGRGETIIKRDLDQGRDEVRVMTVHGAKGLEAPIVFLADTVRVPEITPAFVWSDGTDNEMVPLWAPIRAMEEEVIIQSRQRAATDRDREYRRLFYVALTRAADQLYICGVEGKTGRSPHCWYDMAWRALDAMPDIERPDQLMGGLRLTRLQGSVPKIVPVSRLEFDRTLPAWAGQPAPKEPFAMRPLTPSRSQDEPLSVISPLANYGKCKFQRGNYIHKLLQILPDLPEDQWDRKSAQYLEQVALVATDIQRAEIRTEALRVLRHPEFAGIFAEGSRAEVPLSAVIGEEVISGQVDRLAITDSEILVIDYKTNRLPPFCVEDIDPVYLRQLASYRAVLMQIFPYKTIRCALLWTSGPKLMVIDKAILIPYSP